MTYQETAKAILAAVGGKTNIQRVTHCVTRLRLVLKMMRKLKISKSKPFQM